MSFYKKEIKELIDGLTPFPENVFVKEQEWANNYFFPLISIDMGILRSDLKGTIVHMLNPIEPYDGLIGEYTTEFHNEFCGENWIAFELSTDNKYRFLNDERYFLSAPQNNSDIFKGLKDKFKTSLEKNKEYYQKVKHHFQNTKNLIADENEPSFLLNFLDNLGGRAWAGNWVDTSPIPSAFEIIEVDSESIDLDYDDVLTIKYGDENFIFVGDVPGYNYCHDGADSILMFYEPKNRIVLFTYDWT